MQFDYKAARAYEEACNQMLEMFDALDEMRRAKDPEEKKQKLFKVHSYEREARKILKAEQERQNPKHKKAA